VEKLVECIKANAQFDGRIRPQSLVGQAAMTDVKQKRTLHNFRLGESLRFIVIKNNIIKP